MNTQIDTQTLVENADIGQLSGVQLRGNSNGERFGPCPKCGGDDRFHVRRYKDREYFFCRHCHEKRGDAIELLKWLHGMTFVEAVRELGGDVANSQRRMPTPRIEPPAAYDTPPTQDWQERMKTALNECVAYLWADTPKAAAARDYLRGRGLTNETIKARGIGYNVSDRRISGHWMYQGFTLPTIICGEIWQVRTRTPPKLVGQPIPANTKGRTYEKYMGVTGNVIGLMNADAVTKQTRVVIATGGEFDAMLCQQFAPDGVVFATFGSETKGFSLRWLIAIRNIERVIVAYDNDDEGDRGYQRIKSVIPHALRARSPIGKDIGEYWQKGGDVGAWIAEIVGIPQPKVEPVLSPLAQLIHQINAGQREISFDFLRMHGIAHSEIIEIVQVGYRIAVKEDCYQLMAL